MATVLDGEKMRSLLPVSPKTVRAFVGIALIDVTAYLISAYYVTVYYTHNPPHFDSVGSLTLMYDYINRVHRDGPWSAWLFALGHDSVSWIQGAYAVLLANVLPRTPTALMTLNFVCLFAAQAALFDLGRQFGASRLHSFAFGLLPLLPNALFGHYGTYQDMRRDASFFGLLLATYCLSLSYVWRPSVVRGLLLGLAAGMTQWARGNALPYTAIILFPAAVWTAARHLATRRWVELLRITLVPMLLFLLFAVPYYTRELSSLLDKYIHNTPDLNTPRWASFAHFAWTPLVLMLGEPGRVFAIKLAILLIGIPALIFVGAKKMELDWRPRQGFAGDRRWLWLGGGWAAVGVLVLITVVVGVSSIAGYEPSFPILIGLFSLLIGFSLTVSFRDAWSTARLKRLLTVVGILLWMFAGSVDKLRLSSYPRQTANVRTAKELVPVLRQLTAGRKVTWMWDGNLNFWVINYYLAQAGEPLLVFYYGVSPDRLPNPDSNETVESRLAETKDALLNTDVLILSDTTNAYAGTLGPGFFDTYGYRIVPDILASQRFEQIYQFQSDGYHFVILKRIQ